MAANGDDAGACRSSPSSAGRGMLPVALIWHGDRCRPGLGGSHPQERQEGARDSTAPPYRFRGDRSVNGPCQSIRSWHLASRDRGQQAEALQAGSSGIKGSRHRGLRDLRIQGRPRSGCSRPSTLTARRSRWSPTRRPTPSASTETRFRGPTRSMGTSGRWSWSGGALASGETHSDERTSPVERVDEALHGRGPGRSSRPARLRSSRGATGAKAQRSGAPARLPRPRNALAPPPTG